MEYNFYNKITGLKAQYLKLRVYYTSIKNYSKKCQEFL